MTGWGEFEARPSNLKESKGVMMRRGIIFLVLMFVAVLASGNAWAQAKPAPAPQSAPTKQIKRDEVYFSLARKVNSASESEVSAVVAELDGVIEVTGISYRTDGKAEVTVKERAPSNASSTNKSSRVVFSPPATGDKWTWEEFEQSGRFYPVDRLFPVVKSELGKRKQSTTATWTAFLNAVAKQGDTAVKVLETAKAIIKTEPPPTSAITAGRTALMEAIKENKYEEIITAYNSLSAQNDPILTLGDSYTDLKANDAYLRLIEEFKNAINLTNASRKNYVQTVDAYNESLQRLPFALAAYGFQFTKIEAKVTAE